MTPNLYTKNILKTVAINSLEKSNLINNGATAINSVITNTHDTLNKLSGNMGKSLFKNLRATFGTNTMKSKTHIKREWSLF